MVMEKELVREKVRSGKSHKFLFLSFFFSFLFCKKLLGTVIVNACHSFVSAGVVPTPAAHLCQLNRIQLDEERPDAADTENLPTDRLTQCKLK